MNNEEKILALLEKMDKRMDTMDKRMDTLEKEQSSGNKLTEMIAVQVEGLTTQVNNITKIVTKIETEHGQKLSALFDGYKQNSDKLDHIEVEVAKHDKFILERIK